MAQSKKMSTVEILTNTSIGVIGSWLLTAYILKTTPGETTGFVLIFTVWSIFRGYAVRRFFNWLHAREDLNRDFLQR